MGGTRARKPVLHQGGKDSRKPLIGAVVEGTAQRIAGGDHGKGLREAGARQEEERPGRKRLPQIDVDSGGWKLEYGFGVPAPGC